MGVRFFLQNILIVFNLKWTLGQSNNFCLKWSFFIIKQNNIHKKIQKFTCNPTNTPRAFHVETTWKHSFPRHFNVKYTWNVCREATISMFCVSFRMYDVSYVEIQFHYWKLRNFVTSWIVVKNIIKLDSKLFLHKTNKYIQRKPWWNILYIRRNDVTYAEFKTF